MKYLDQINGIIIPYNESTEQLVEMLDFRLTDFRVACEALSQKEDKLSFLTLIKLLKNDDPYKRRIGLECLGKHKDFSDEVDVVISCLDDESPYVVRTAIEVIKSHSIAQAESKIFSLLKSNNELTRESAISSLEYLSKEIEVDFLIELYNDKNEKISKQAVNLILLMCNKTNWQKAYNILKRSDNEKARLIACKLLVKFGSEKEKSELAIFLHDKNGHIRKYSETAMLSN